MGFLEWLETTAYADWILTSSVGWPLMLAAHSLGLAIIVGLVIAVDLRLLGLYRTIPLASLHRFVVIAWTGFVINLFSGLSLFTTQASSYITNGPFLAKMAFIIIGCVNLVYMQKILKGAGGSWDAAGRVPREGTLLAVTSLLFWGLAVVTGRLIAYL